MLKGSDVSSMVLGSTTIYNDSPTLLPRTPLAPGIELVSKLSTFLTGAD
jgi:hypothetical protein